MKKVQNKHVKNYVQRLEPFVASNLKAIKIGMNYIVLSYNWWPLFIYQDCTKKWFENQDRYSKTTSAHRTYSHPNVRTQLLDSEQMKTIMCSLLL